MAWLPDLVEWWQRWMLLVALVAFAVVFTCALARRTKWILPVWLLFLVATGLHTAWLLLLISAGLTDFAAMGVMFLVMFSWPVSVTFIALPFIRPRRREETNAA
jgi:hypothetical protein